jgi:transposase
VYSRTTVRPTRSTRDRFNPVAEQDVALRMLRWRSLHPWTKLVALVLAGRSPEELADEFEPTGQTIRNWVRQAQFDAGDRKDGLTSDERQEIARLCKRVTQLEMEREIRSKVTAWFARKNMEPKRSSDL